MGKADDATNHRELAGQLGSSSTVSKLDVPGVGTLAALLLRIDTHKNHD